MLCARSERGRYVRSGSFTQGVEWPRRERRLSDELEEIQRHVSESGPDEPWASSESVGRPPVGPARGWRQRARREEACDICHGDLWLEKDDGELIPCDCRQDRVQRRAKARLRARGWVRGFSLSLESAALVAVPAPAKAAVAHVCRSVEDETDPGSLWIVGREGAGKTALSSYMAQRLVPRGLAVVERLGDLLAELRWLVASEGRAALAGRFSELVETPLLVLDDLDRPARKHRVSSLTFEESCTPHDLLALAQILEGRRNALLPVVLTSRSLPADCLDRVVAIRRRDLVRGLVSIASGQGDPIEDFPDYPIGLLRSAMDDLQQDAAVCKIDPPGVMLAAA